MDSPSYLRDKAEHCRRLARLIKNADMSAELLKLAVELEAKAAEAITALAQGPTARGDS